MSPAKTKLLWATLAVTALALALLLIRFDRTARQTRAEVLRVEEQRRAVETKLAQAKARAASARAPVTPAVAPAPAAPLPPKPTPPTEAEALLERENQRRALLRTWAAQVYAPFLRSATLSPAQVEAFETTLIDHFVRWAEIVDAGRGQGVTPTDQNIWKEFGKKEEAQFRQEQREALGPDAFQQLRQYERTAPLKPVADAVAGAVFDSEPLTADQAQTLMRVLANNSPRFQNGGQASLDDINLSSAFTQLDGVLTPGQINALQTSLAARAAMRKLSQSLAKARQAEGKQ